MKELTLDKLTLVKQNVDDLTVDKLAVGNLTLNKLAVDNLTVDNLPAIILLQKPGHRCLKLRPQVASEDEK